MATCLIALGSNLEDRADLLQRAVDLMAGDPDLELSQVSRFYETPPIGGPGQQGAFLNGVARVTTACPPEGVLSKLQAIEDALHRRREVHWGPRSMDLDLLLYDDLVLNGPRLTLPHPRMSFRRFVLEGAQEVAPRMLHPTTGLMILELAQMLESRPDYVALVGVPGSGKTQLGRLVARACGAAVLETVMSPSPDTAHAPAEQKRSPSGRSLQREIEFVEAHRRVLEQARWELPTISDFWFGQSLAYAEVELDPPLVEECRRACLAASQSVRDPKLIVLLGKPSAAGSISDGPVETSEASRHEVPLSQLHAALRRCAQDRQAAVLDLSGVDAVSAAQEIQAAILAMH
jgi:2-amino-4-hydroxy-6-hydroxymethyldihydropteridine diphosphokinase